MKTYEKLDKGIKEILSNRLSNNKAKQFKELLRQFKENYGFTISKEYIKNTLFKDDSRKFQMVLSQRIKRILKKAEIKAVKKPRFYKVLTSDKGVLFYEYRKKLLTFLIV